MFLGLVADEEEAVVMKAYLHEFGTGIGRGDEVERRESTALQERQEIRYDYSRS